MAALVQCSMADAVQSGFDRVYLEEKLEDAEQRLIKSRQHIEALHAQVKELEVLYKRAQRTKKQASRYNLRLKLSVLSGKSIFLPILQLL